MTHSIHCAVLGSPIAHSLSPVLHRAAYQYLGLDDWQYDKYDVNEDQFDGFLRSLDESWRGLSLTMPLKRTIQPYGTPSNFWAQELQIANTAVFDWDGAAPHIALYNTDVYGIARAFQKAGYTAASCTNAHAVIIGNGNTANSALAAIIMMGSADHVTVIARQPKRSTHLIELATKHHITVDTLQLSDLTRVDTVLHQASIVISTIPAHGADAIAAYMLQHEQPVQGTLLDVVYDPRPTALMRAWRDCGGVAIGGEQMLLHQAVAQVTLMTGMAAPYDYDSCVDEPHNLPLETAMAQALQEAL